MKKFLSIVLSILMVVTMIPMTAYAAADTSPYAPTIAPDGVSEDNNIFANGTPITIEAAGSGTAVWYMDGGTKKYVNPNGANGDDLSDYNIYVGSSNADGMNCNGSVTMTGGTVKTIFAGQSYGGFRGTSTITVIGGTIINKIFCNSSYGSRNDYVTTVTIFDSTGATIDPGDGKADNVVQKKGSNWNVSGNGIIPEGITVSVSEGETLTVPSGATLTNNGALVNNGGTIKIYGKLSGKAPENYSAPTDISFNTETVKANVSTTLQEAVCTTSNTTLLPRFTYEIVDKGTTEAVLSGMTLTPYNEGTVKIKVTMQDGYCEPISKTFDFPVSFTKVTSISGTVPTEAWVNMNVTLPTMAVTPEDASYKTVVWSVANANGTGATINGSTLKATNAGAATIRATVENGTAYGTAFTKDYTVAFKESETIDISLGSITISKKNDTTLIVTYSGFSGGSKGYMVGEPIQITGTTSSNTVTVESGVVADIIIDNLNVSSGSGNPFYVKSGANVTLTLKNTNSFTTSDADAAALRVPAGAVLTIDGDGTLTADSTSGTGYGAGIGGESDLIGESGGKILILGGTVTAISRYGAGIGGGAGLYSSGVAGNGGSITVSGGNVTATSIRGAGIGGGSSAYHLCGSGGIINITGGNVTATSGYGAGIGGGGTGESSIQNGTAGEGGIITISGGTVTASSTNRYGGAGIGSGGSEYGTGNIGGTVTITGGTVKATTAATNGEAIGKGYKGTSSGALQDGYGNPVTLYTFTLSGTSNANVTAQQGLGSYGVNDVKTQDADKLYFYLPAESVATSFTAGGTVYDCVVGLTYYPGHSYLEATCFTAKTCTTCGLTEGEALGHNMVDGICTVCGMGEADGIFYISTAKQLMVFADFVNKGNVNANATLMADIDLAEYTWTPIGVTAMGEGVTNGYTGSFDGNGHVIRNITFATPTSAMAAGIFGTVQYGGTVRNLGVENLSFDDNTYDHRAGGIAGQLLADSTISDCYVSNSTVKASSRVVGGIVGMNNGTVKNCYTYNMTLAGYNNRFGGISGDFSAGKLENCYTDYSALASSQAGTATNCKAGVSADVFASGEIAYLLNGSASEGELVWGQLIGTDSYPVFGGETVYYNESNGYYNILHTCDFSGEWKYDADKHWKECTVDGCSETSEDAEHSFTDGKCDCGYTCPHSSYTNGICDKCDYECPHSWGEGVLTRPVYDAVLGSKDGYYTYTCTVCGDEKKEAVKGAGYSAYEAVSEEINGLLQSDDLTPEAKQAIYSAANECGLLSNDLMESEQNIVDDLVAKLEKIIADADEKIASGEYVKADYTAIDEAIAEIEKKLADENVTDEAKAELEEIKSQLEEKKADENTSKADLAELEEALEDYETELDAGIEDGSAVKVNGQEIFNEKIQEINDELIEKYGEEIKKFSAALPDEVVAGIEERTTAIYNEMSSLEGSVKDNEEKLAEFKEELEAIFAELENCFTGTHNGLKFEVTAEAKCGKNAVESAVCTLCGETVTREVENSALTHSFTKYEVTEEAKCGVEGKKVAACDNGCGATDEKAIEALKHLFVDYIYNEDATCTADGTKTAECIYGCGETDTVTAEDTMLDHADEDGDKLCDDCGEEVYDRCDICGGKAHGDDKIQLVFCMIITIIRFVTSILKSIN